MIFKGFQAKNYKTTEVGGVILAPRPADTPQIGGHRACPMVMTQSSSRHIIEQQTSHLTPPTHLLRLRRRIGTKQHTPRALFAPVALFGTVIPTGVLVVVRLKLRGGHDYALRIPTTPIPPLPRGPYSMMYSPPTTTES